MLENGSVTPLSSGHFLRHCGGGELIPTSREKLQNAQDHDAASKALCVSVWNVSL